MLDPKIIRQNKDLVQKAYENRGYDVRYLDDFEAVDKTWRDKLQDVDKLKQERNQTLPKGKPSPEQLAQLKQLSESIKDKQGELQQLSDQVPFGRTIATASSPSAGLFRLRVKLRDSRENIRPY